MQRLDSIHWQPVAIVATLLSAWLLLALWQWQEFQAESQSARESVQRQAESIINVLVGGVQSHRRLGRFLEEQLQGVLDELAKSQDVLAVALSSKDRRMRLTAGQAELLDEKLPVESGWRWEPSGFRYAVAFQVTPEPINPPGMSGGPPGIAGVRPDMPPGGMGPGRGGGWGWGRRADLPEHGPQFPGGRFQAVLLLDRSRTDGQIARYAWLRIAVTAAGGLVLASVALAWGASVRLAEARGRSRLLEIEARHLRELSQAAAGLAHETRNPLGLIRGWTQRWAQTLRDNPQQRQQAQTVIEECDRLTARINQFLAFTRPCKPNVSDVRLSDVTSELATLLEPDLTAKQLRLVTELSAVGKTVRADREMLRQALFNLLQNALEFSPVGGTVEIAAQKDQNGEVKLEVSDCGPGVPPQSVDLLFTPYHTTRPSGTGLGLAIVRRIATAHGWTTGYTPRPGGGATFWMDGIHG